MGQMGNDGVLELLASKMSKCCRFKVGATKSQWVAIAHVGTNKV